jgi:hypothetical protein
MASHFSAVLPFDKGSVLKTTLTQFACKPLPLRPEKRLCLVFHLGETSPKIFQLYCRIDDSGDLVPIKIREWAMRHFVITQHSATPGMLDYRVKVQSKLPTKPLDTEFALDDLCISILETIRNITGFRIDENTGRLHLHKSSPTPALHYAQLKVKSVFERNSLTIRVNKVYSTSGRGFTEFTAGADLNALGLLDESNQDALRDLLFSIEEFGFELTNRLYETDKHFHDQVKAAELRRPRWMEHGENGKTTGPPSTTALPPSNSCPPAYTPTTHSVPPNRSQEQFGPVPPQASRRGAPPTRGRGGPSRGPSRGRGRGAAPRGRGTPYSRY